VSAEPLRLTSSQGTLPVRLYREAFVLIDTPSNSQGATGRWPDPLIPVQDVYEVQTRRALPADSTSEEPLILYLEVCVPEHATPTSYRGELRLSDGHGPLGTVEITLAVHRFSLPATSSLPNTFGLSLYSMAKGHGLDAQSPEAKKLLAQYMRALLAHRVSAHGLSMDPPIADWRSYDAELEPFLEGHALLSGARFTTTDLRSPPKGTSAEGEAAYYRRFRQHFQERSWNTLLFYYAKDEPKPKDYPLVQQRARAVHAAQINAQVLITSPPNPELNASADILCPVLNCFFPRSGPATCEHAQSAASIRAQLRPRAKLFWYQSCMSHGCDRGPLADPTLDAAFRGWASYMVDHPGTLNRAMGPLAFFAGVDGELYFDTLASYASGDPWKSVFAFGGNGDGTFFYPGTPSRLGGTSHFPVESLRLKTLRDGLEDYEYLKLLVDSGEGDFARSSVRRLVRSGYEIEENPEVWEAVRRQWAQRLEQRR
jgi:hypothetical protein